MKPLTLFLLTVQAALLALAGLSVVNADLVAGLPIKASAERPALLLELGSEPLSLGVDDKTTRMFAGVVHAHEGDASIQTDKDEISSLHPGFGSWKLGFRFNIKPGFPARPYTFWARWRQGGDPNGCLQTFEVWAGPDSSRLELRATLSMKPKGWDYAWIAAESPVKLKADDAVIEVRNSGAGHDAKVFDAFLLKLETPLGDWMSAEQAQARNRFLALTKVVPDARHRLVVLDGKGENDAILFRGLAADAARPRYEKLPVAYLIGPESEALARSLTIPTLPAAVMTDDHYGLLGVLTNPENEQDVSKFLSDPGKIGTMPTAAPGFGGPPEAAQQRRTGCLAGGRLAGRPGGRFDFWAG